ncbi:glycosyl transferase family 1 [Flavobacterium sp. MEB061]|uniref:glycosyltransferase family 4 protein n=1 Tax=Flavobacterium sp. MEB061 TaxID=1587524 RepID=UPI0005AC2F6D|nr:glycosyltransferase family 4 protein [Flavobacterium sp. MEB061]KIQ18733.1 glycosyl transferase family 1 [Flavobacterium sp. MEB061]
MKILMVSIPSLHFFRWTSQLQDSGHEVYWFDITGMSEKSERLNWVSQKVGWKLKWNYPGRLFVKKKFPKVYQFLQHFNEYKTASVFEQYLNEIKPDVVHSFALYLSCTPIISVMEKKSNQKWIYSSWGSDLFYFQNDKKYLKDIKRVLPRVNYLFTDCKRDYEIAKKYGFSGDFLGVFPGGGGFDLAHMEQFKLPLGQRNVILLKGFQGRSGRAISVLKAMEFLKNELSDYSIVVFGSDKETLDYAKKSILKDWSNFQIIGKISHQEVIELMGKSKIYIGNSNSDGIPNTLLEAICMEVYPIQSNPGGATAEVINHGVNGLLIENCEDVSEIKSRILDAIYRLPSEDYLKNDLLQLEYNYLKEKVKDRYNSLSVTSIEIKN